MNPAAIHHALHSAEVKGTPRMALLVMAVLADHRGRVQISYRELGRMCGVSAQVASDAVSALRVAKLIQIVDAGAGTAASVWQVLAGREGLAQGARKTQETPAKLTPKRADAKPEPEPSVRAEKNILPQNSVKHDAAPEKPLPPPFNPALPPWAPRSDVGRALLAARAQPHPDQPLYWHRKEHAAELEALCIAARVTVDQLCNALTRIEPQPKLRRIRDLAEALKEGAKG